MINLNRFNEVLVSYKESFAWRWSSSGHDEQYKWKAIKHFQDHWNINAEDFAAMLKESLSKTSNLLASAGRFPGGMMVSYAQAAPEEVRAMFLALFDESEDVVKRIAEFKASADKLHEWYGEKGKNHFQDENSITTYLWLRYPDKHYIYKYSLARGANDYLKAGYAIKKGYVADNVRNGIAFNVELNDLLKEDADIVGMLQDQLTPDCYDDPELCTVTVDFEYFTYHYAKDKSFPKEIAWWPSKDEYDPGIAVEQWIDLIKDESVFNRDALQIVMRLREYGGAATCTQLAERYGKTSQFYNAGSVALAKRVADKTGCPIMDRDSENSRWWPILYIGRRAGKEESGSYVWRLRDELVQALEATGVDMTIVEDNDRVVDPPSNERRFWWLVASPRQKFRFGNLQVGGVEAWTLYNDTGTKRRIFQNFLDARAGDLVVGYESTPVKQIVALCKIAAEQDGECLLIEKVEGLANPIDYSALQEIPDLAGMQFFSDSRGSLFSLSEDEYETIIDIVREANPIVNEGAKIESYGKEDFLGEVYMTESRYDHLVAVLRNKKNVILQGAPGVGKTFAANRLAWSIMGMKDDSRIEFVQFHQNYSYEDFMMGYKPEGDSFVLKYGVFYRFCQKAANQPDKEFFFIIDEINRGNMSKVFGELLMLIENDYRGKTATLAYNGLPFSVPENLYIIGMMNTADRSLAMIDYALRRRFSFFEIEPGFDSAGFQAYQKSLDDETLDDLIEKVKELNRAIAQDRALGNGFRIGHSYFCGRKECTDEWLHEVVEFDIMPMLSEYWFDNKTELAKWDNILHGTLS